MDLRSYDLSPLDMSENLEELLHADFNTLSRWPYYLPKPFNPKTIMNLGRNPGLGVRRLNKSGITGKNVSVAVIGRPILVEHLEYQSQIMRYEELSSMGASATSSGTAALSVIAGRNVGVAPDSEIYYIASDFSPDMSKPDKSGTDDSEGYNIYYDTPEIEKQNIRNSGFIVDALERVIEINTMLTVGNKIKLVYINTEWHSDLSGAEGVLKIVKRLQDEGIFVISSYLYDMYGREMDFNGLGRDPLKDPEELASYGPGGEWANNFYSFGRYVSSVQGLLVPTDSRTVASPTGKKDYAFYAMSDKNMAAAYIAGLYALACQVKPDIKPEEFWSKALETGEVLELERNNIKYRLKMIVNPEKLIEAVK